MNKELEQVQRKFNENIAEHELTIMHDDGVSVSLCFGKSNSSIYRFYVTTTPNYLCIMGDMGSFVFSNNPSNMLAWINDNVSLGYITEKMKAGVAKEYSEEKARARLRYEVEKFCESIFPEVFLDENSGRYDEILEEWTDDLFERVEGEICFESEELLYKTAYELSLEINDELTFDIEMADGIDCEDYTYRFKWCVLALNHVASLYFNSKKEG